MPLPATLPPGDRHAHLTGIKLAIVRAIHHDVGWMSTQQVADATGKDMGYIRRFLTELHDEGIVDRARDGSYTGRGAGPYIWSCCGR